MKNLSIAVDEETWEAANQLAAEQRTTIDALVARYLRSIADQRNADGSDVRAQARRELAQVLGSCGAEVGEQPSRERTYRDRRFS